MIQADNVQALFDLESPSERCERVLNEVQPKLRGILDLFKERYRGLYPELNHYEVHTYESTLRTTMYTARDPEIAQSILSRGKKAFVRLQKSFEYGDPVSLLQIEFNGIEKLIQIKIESTFYPLWMGVKENTLSDIIGSLGEDIKVMVQDPNFHEFEVRDCINEIKNYIEKKKQPYFSFGVSIPLEGEISEEFLVEKICSVWDKLEDLRNFLLADAEIHSKTIHVIEQLKSHEGSYEVSLYNHKYEIEYHKAEKPKPHFHRQKFSLYDNGQLIEKGQIFYYLNVGKYHPHEVLSVIISGHEYIFTGFRPLVQSEQYRWEVSKLFAMKNTNNHELLQKAMTSLNENGIEAENGKYYLGTYDNVKNFFVEKVEDVKEKIAKAALIFADVSGRRPLPRVDLIPVIDNSGYLDDEYEGQLLTSNFDLLSILEIIGDSGFTFSKDIIRDFHLSLTSLDDKHFVILNGISGTGKTQLCRLYANAVYGLDYEAENPYLCVIPVRPDWMESTALFGYYSSFEKRYVVTEFLEIVLRALKEREKPHFVILDEMNLARVEYYLSDYLSAVESRKPICLHSQDNVADVPKTIEIPPNLYVIGTINVDETTHSISDKVLDRAFVMTLSDVDFQRFWGSLENDIQDVLDREFEMLLSVHQKLLKYDLHFGYRTMYEMIMKLYRNRQLPEDIQMEQMKAVDRVVSEKVLPKLRGDDRIMPLLEELSQWCTEQLGIEAESLRHLVRMKGELERYGATQFWR
ncbi:McrB family protein [Aneurinibacillus uraniidurans]|uniref:McrB family protein n=1 Tax=Aneurinibacillus uraniidurans TaxID=2966586 RepID=UPI00234AC09F|nr:hypothetical protein [Aneurinibacillus sp. B1]WCN36195.1 hypothetical protein PO771_09840 [Aneurinibacillus sp. B1]